MYQQINMYQPVLRRQVKIFSAATLLKVVAMATVLLLAVYVHARWTVHGLQRTAADLTLNYRQLDTRLVALEGDAAAGTNAAASKGIAELQEQISERTMLLERIDRLAIDTATGFGEVFETLAQQDVPGLWLTGLRLDQDGNTEIRGGTLDPKLVPRYLQLMSQQPRLAALNDGTVSLVRPASDQAEINFTLSYRAQGALR